MFYPKKANHTQLLNEINRVKSEFENGNVTSRLSYEELNGASKEVVEGFNELLALLYTQVEKTEAKFDLVTKAGKVGVWDFDFKDGVPVDPNRYSDSTRDMFGYKGKDDFPDTYASWAKTVHPEEMPAI